MQQHISDAVRYLGAIAARTADKLETVANGDPSQVSASDLGAATKQLANALEYIRLGLVAVGTMPLAAPHQQELNSMAAELRTLLERVDAIGTAVWTSSQP